MGGPGALLAASVLYPGRNDKYGDGVVTRIDFPNLRFSELERAGVYPDRRAYFTGKSATIIGQFVAEGDSTQFTLVRYLRRCCAADAVPLNAVITVHPNWQGERLNVKARQQKWVRVTGRIFFLRKRGSADDYVPALILFPGQYHEPDKLVEIMSQPADPYAS
jgi:uncharacterized membrane protein YcgQ (UPF0703/DUF1980 family)